MKIIGLPFNNETGYIYSESDNIDYNTLDGLSLGVGEPDDVANLTVFLVSDKARRITGQNYILDGGYLWILTLNYIKSFIMLLKIVA